MPAKSKRKPSIIGELDQHLFCEGRHWQLHKLLGAHSASENGVPGVRFSVWAPAAKQVNVVGNFNEWQGAKHTMQVDSSTGIWQLFVPELGPGTLYKYEVTDRSGRSSLRSDPVGFYAEIPPQNASIVFDLNGFRWRDEDWMQQRPTHASLDRPWAIYEVHLGSWRQDPKRNHGWINYRELARQLVEYCLEMGFTHLQLMPVSEHPYTGSWGYQTVGYFAATSRFGDPHDFMYFVDYCHRHGIGVMIDWVPAHFPRDAHGLRRFDGSALYEHLDPRRGEHPDWGTMIFNYGRNEVRNFLIANALFWLQEYHIDGLRVDAVASMLYLDYSRQEGQWIPNQYGGRENLEAVDFLREFNRQVHQQHPGAVTIAEESTAWPGVSHSVDVGGLGFDMKWNMGWMNDSLRYIQREPVYRRYHQNELTFSIWYAFSESFVLPLSHDEVVHGKRSLIEKMPGDRWQRFANLRLLFSYMWSHPGKKLLFMGSELGQYDEWNCDREIAWSLLEDPLHAGLQKMVGQLNQIYNRHAALHQTDFHSQGFEWIDFEDARRSIIAFVRYTADHSEHLVVICNFTPVVHEDMRFGLPAAGIYETVMCTDDTAFGGSGCGVAQTITTEAIEFHRRAQSAKLTVPPLGTLILKLRA